MGEDNNIFTDGLEIMNKINKLILILATIAGFLSFFILFSYVLDDNDTYVIDTKEVEWSYGLDTFTIEVPDNYIQIPTVRAGFPTRLNTFVDDSPAVERIAKYVNGVTWNTSISHKTYVLSKILSSNLTYEEDDWEHWKRPWETIRDGKGDCEDYAILAVSVLTAMHIDSIFVVEKDHVLVGVKTNKVVGLGNGIEYHGKFYEYVEFIEKTYPGEAKANPYICVGTNISGYNVVEIGVAGTFLCTLLYCTSRMIREEK